jgi:hypothetical protein
LPAIFWQKKTGLRPIASLTPDERGAYSEYLRKDESRSRRDLEVVRSLVRVLKEPRGLAIPLVDELRELLRPSQ